MSAKTQRSHKTKYSEDTSGTHDLLLEERKFNQLFEVCLKLILHERISIFIFVMQSLKMCNIVIHTMSTQGI